VKDIKKVIGKTCGRDCHREDGGTGEKEKSGDPWGESTSAPCKNGNWAAHRKGEGTDIESDQRSLSGITKKKKKKKKKKLKKKKKNKKKKKKKTG